MTRERNIRGLPICATHGKACTSPHLHSHDGNLTFYCEAGCPKCLPSGTKGKP